MNSAKITLKVNFDASGYRKGIKELEKSLDSLVKKAESLAKNVQKASSAMAAGQAKAAKSTTTAAEREAAKQQKAAEKAARAQEKAAEQASKVAQREAAKVARAAEQAARAQAKAAEQARKAQEKAAQQATKAAEREAAKQAKAAQQAADKAEKEFRDFGRSAGNAFTGLTKVALGAFAAIAAGMAAALAVLGGSDGALKAAMNVESSLANINRIFGENGKAMTKWAQSMTGSLGMAEDQVLKYTASYGQMLKRTTSDVEELSALTREMVAMTAVISSNTGYSNDIVFEKIASGIRGETEAIEDLGIDLRVKSIENSTAFKMIAEGQGLKWADMSTEMQQQIATLTILEQAYLVHGTSIAATVGGEHTNFINSLKGIKYALGQAFLPIYATILPSLKALASWITNLMVKFGQLTYALFGNSKAMKAIAEAQKKNQSVVKNSIGQQVANMGAANKGTQSNNKLAKSTEKVGTAAKKTAKEVKKATKSVQGFDILNRMAAESSNEAADAIDNQAKDIATPSMPSSGSSFADTGFDIDFGETEEIDYKSILDKMQKPSKEIERIAEEIRSAWAKVKEAWDTGVGFFKKDKDSGESPFDGFLDKYLPGIAGFMATLATLFAVGKFAKIASLVKTGLTLIGAVISGISWPVVGIAVLIGVLVAAIVDLWRNSEEFRDNVGKIWDSIKERISTAWETTIKPVLDSLKETFTALWEDSLGPLYEKTKELIEKFVEFFAVLMEKSQPVYDFFAGLFGPGIVFIFEAVGEIIEVVFGVISEVIMIFWDLLIGIMDFIMNVFKGDWEAAFQGISDTFEKIWNGILNIGIRVVNGIIGIINGMIAAVEGAANALAGVLNDIFGKVEVPDWVPHFGGKSIDMTIGKVTLPRIDKIPMLAQGGVIPPNDPRLFIAGDNTQEDEIIAPESKLQRMANNAVTAAGNNNNGNIGNAEVIALLKQLNANLTKGFSIELNKKTFGTLVNNHIVHTSNKVGGTTTTFKL